MKRHPPQRFEPSPPPGARGRADKAREPGNAPPLPSATIGAPPGAHPGVARPAPRLGGIRGVGAPPELRRRVPGAIRAAPGAPEIADRIRSVLRGAQLKLLAAHLKLQFGSAARRAEVLGSSQVL